MQIILAGSAKVYQMAAYFGLYNYWLAAAEIRNGANGGAWRLRDLGERDKLGKDRGGDWRREDGGRDKRGPNFLYVLGKVGNKVISSEAGRRWRGREG